MTRSDEPESRIAKTNLMNTDPLEKMLREQPLREIPPHWRPEILSAARQAQPHVSRVTCQVSRIMYHVSRLRALLWPSPQAWAGLATVWLVILAVNFAERHPAPPASVSAGPGGRPGFTFKDQERLLGELLLFAEPVGVQRTGPSSPAPATERHAPGGASDNRTALHHWA